MQDIRAAILVILIDEEHEEEQRDVKKVNEVRMTCKLA